MTLYQVKVNPVECEHLYYWKYNRSFLCELKKKTSLGSILISYLEWRAFDFVMATSST